MPVSRRRARNHSVVYARISTRIIGQNGESPNVADTASDLPIPLRRWTLKPATNPKITSIAQRETIMQNVEAQHGRTGFREPKQFSNRSNAVSVGW